MRLIIEDKLMKCCILGIQIASLTKYEVCINVEHRKYDVVELKQRKSVFFNKKEPD